jgi:hypothetical protein
MRNLADLHCPRCARRFYGDLPAGQALFSPMLLEADTGKVHDPHGCEWFARFLADSYAQRVNEPVSLRQEQLRPLQHPVLLNCLDHLYGHSLLKLLNAQYYLDHRPDQDLVVLVPRFLRWLVPAGAAAIWTLDLPLRQGHTWNDWLAARLHELIDPLPDAALSLALSHPHPEEFDIARYSQVVPFDVAQWQPLLRQRPTVTFIWREDRVWDGAPDRLGTKLRRLGQRLGRRLRPAGTQDWRTQERLVTRVAEAMRRSFPKLDFALAGLGRPGRIPGWMTDLRQPQIDEAGERAWCKRYARSHLVLGVHGSNMLLPSAHAGGVLELLPSDRWGNLIQDILPRAADARDALFRFRFLPLTSDTGAVVEAASTLLRQAASAALAFSRPWCDHAKVSADPTQPARRRQEILCDLDAAPAPRSENADA